MKLRLLYTPVLAAMLLFACGNDTQPADPQPDAPPPNEPCNPVTQAGCDAGEKCAELVESEEPLLNRTTCVPNGTAAEGETCSRGAAGVETGFDDCVSGQSCLNGTCSPICSANPDSCREASEAFGEGDYCTLFADLYSDNVGLCVAGCNPVAADSCGDGFGCYLEATRGIASCAGVPAPAQDLAQNSDCFGPATGGCFLNGCAPGFTPMLNNKPENADGSVCARYCTPGNSYEGSAGELEGLGGNCSISLLAETGGTNGNNSAHQCRFIQSFYGNTDNLPEELGMCVPISPLGGGTWGDCGIFDWDGIKLAWNGAVEAGTDPNVALNDHCLETPSDPQNSETLPKCIGLFRGCLSLAESDSGLLDPSGGAFQSRTAWAASIGLQLPDRIEAAAGDAAERTDM
jgi:hypothetical protein